MDEGCSLEVLWARVRALETLIEVKREADQRALSLQAAEYERRLQALNHAHQQATERNAHFISRELYEAKWLAHEEYERAQDAKLENTQRLVFVGVGLVLAVELVLRFLA